VAQALPARSPDGKTYTFTIRPGFRFSPPSNEPVTAQTFKDTIERTLDPRMQSPVAHEFEDIVGSAAYVAGKAPDIAGIVVRGDQLTIHLVAPAPDLLTRIAEPAGCAVPSKTPVDPSGTQTIPSAGPYYATSYDPSQGIVLERNPNYRSTRPHRLQRIEFAVGVSNKRALADVKAGTADYTRLSGPGAANLRSLASQLAARYGPESRAAKRGAQQYFAGPELALDYFVLNTHRPLFGDARMRKAVSYAIDRRSLAQLGNGIDPLPDRPADHYLPPGMPGYRDTHVYPLMPDPAKARALAQGTGRTAVLYTCDVYPCTEQAQILKADLAAIGLHLRVRSFSYDTMFAREQKPGQPFDIGFYSWADDNPDPAGMLPLMLDYSRGYTTLSHRRYERRLAAIARLTGLQRYLAYGKLDIDIARNDAPLVAYGNPSSSDFFSARIGCQSYSVYGGIDLAALCLKHESHQ
jgi:peptide/nickel transport system substrate-binding protein